MQRKNQFVFFIFCAIYERLGLDDGAVPMPPLPCVIRGSEDWGGSFISECVTMHNMRAVCGAATFLTMSGCNFPISQVKDGEWTSPRTFLLEGVPIHDFFTKNPAALREMIVNFQTRHDDVFVVSYPKSGEDRRGKLETQMFYFYAWIIW